MVLLRMMILLVRDVLLASNAAVQAGVDMFMFCCANNSLFCNSSVFLLSSALLPSDPCFSARQSCKNYSYKLTIFYEAALRGRSTGAQTPRRASIKIFVRCGEQYCAVRS